MGSNPPNSGNGPPAKPWERVGSSSGPAPFKPPSSGNTSDVVEASGTARPGEAVSTVNTTANTNALARPVPARPWQQNYGSGIGAGYGSSVASGIGTGLYSSYGGYGGGSYAGGMYGTSNNMYGGGGYGGGLYGGSGMYGGSMYNSGGYGMGMGSSMGMGMGSGMGMGMGMGGPYGNQDPNDPYGGPPSPPGFWVSFLRVMHGVVNFFGRISVLIDQNTHAFHMFMSALLQLFDRSGMLYGELARFVLRILGIRTKTNKQQQELGPGDLQHPNMQHQQQYTEGPKALQPSSGAWDNVRGNDPTVGSS